MVVEPVCKLDLLMYADVCQACADKVAELADKER
jgi:hypothetical protein